VQLDEAAIFAGPAETYDVLLQPDPLDQFEVVGRYAFDTWWVVLLEDEAQGWINDAQVTIDGYTGLVPLVDAPPVDGGTPAPVLTWNPTPFPDCTVTPTATSTLTPTLEASSTPTLSPTVALADTDAAASDGATNAAEVAATANTADAVEAADAVDVSQEETVPSEVPVTEEESPEPTVPPLVPEAETGGVNWLLYAGGALIVASGAAFVISRRGAASAGEGS
jgi:hypothetical protein